MSKRKRREPVILPDEECERLRRTEMNGLRMLLAHLSTACYFQEDIQDRLKMIRYGKERLQMAVGGLRSVCDDIIGTVTRDQAKQIKNTMCDFDLRMVPKATPESTKIIMTREQGIMLMNLARERCHGCVEDGTGCRKCELYRLLESTTPLDDYGDGLICPYSLAQWE